MCCNGVIFADVKLQRGDNVPRLRSLGLPIPHSELRIPHSTGSASRAPHFTQPCAALEGCRCRIYDERPEHCRNFDCLLLKNVKFGKIKPAAALRKIKLARKLADKVLRLLRQLGNNEETVALSVRFRQVTRRINQGQPDTKTSDAYSKLTLAVQDLNVLLSQSFYPGP
jgi:Fe-S-cluster containining protein